MVSVESCLTHHCTLSQAWDLDWWRHIPPVNSFFKKRIVTNLNPSLYTCEHAMRINHSLPDAAIHSFSLSSQTSNSDHTGMIITAMATELSTDDWVCRLDLIESNTMNRCICKMSITHEFNKKQWHIQKWYIDMQQINTILTYAGFSTNLFADR